jgi:heparosan-N-sulfate-glucuronate 5-epimerase
MKMAYPETLPVNICSTNDRVHTVTKENDTILLPKGNASLDETLGGYYIDMSQALIHYTDGIFGDFDEAGVPLVGWGDRAVYYPVTIAQYGFILHEIWLCNNNLVDYLNKMHACLKWFESNKETYKETYVWRQPLRDAHYQLEPGWASAMSQGEVISFYLRMYQITNDKSLLETAIKAYDFMKFDVSEGGVRRYDKDRNLWFEEYPTKEPSLVLNGFIYALFGLYDLYRVTKIERVKNDIDLCITTLKENISKYDVGYWSLYDQMHKELVKYYYQKNVHVPQMEALYDLTGEEIFKFYAEKWKKTINPINFAFVQVMYRVLPRVQRIKKLIS